MSCSSLLLPLTRAVPCNRGKHTRGQSLLLHLRKLNNWVKGRLIGDVRPVERGGRELTILDLACGKGGDFPKYKELASR
jgi:mRNA (guanine-N7-)-methyltransferase